LNLYFRADANGRQSRILSLVSVLRSLDVLKSDDLWVSGSWNGV